MFVVLKTVQQGFEFALGQFSEDRRSFGTIASATDDQSVRDAKGLALADKIGDRAIRGRCWKSV